MLISITSTTVSLSWDPPRVQYQNGVIVRYAVNVCDEQLLDCTVEISIGTSYTVSELHPFYTFYINVAAVTTGVGPPSSYKKFTCLEDGINHVYISMMVVYNVSMHCA